MFFFKFKIFLVHIGIPGQEAIRYTLRFLMLGLEHDGVHS